ncbi:MAG: hypothetical protein FVQ77_00075 [Cytophagales bacterium]|nr:hypothetical protein [Cytophagales bacterium]
MDSLKLVNSLGRHINIVGNRQSAVGSPQSTVHSRQLAVGSPQSTIGSWQSIPSTREQSAIVFCRLGTADCRLIKLSF